MPATTADDLLPLTAQVHRAGRRLEQAPTRRGCRRCGGWPGFATASMTEAALAYERQAIEPELIARVQDAAEALVFGDRLREVGIDGEGYRGGALPAHGLLAPGPAELAENDAFVEATLDVAAGLRTVADDLEQAWDDLPDARQQWHLPQQPRATSEPGLRELTAESLRTLQETANGAPPAGADDRERAMVLLTFARTCLEHGLLALEMIEDDERPEVIFRRAQPVARAPALYRSLRPGEQFELLRLAEGVLVADDHL